MSKKNFVLVLAFASALGLAGSALAQEPAEVGPGQGSAIQNQAQNQEQAQVQAENQGEEQMAQIQAQVQVQNKAKEIEELKAMVKAQKQEKNQNSVRQAVKNLLATEDLSGGIGQQVSAIAREFNNSAEKTEQAENKIQERNMLKKLFFGGDQAAATEIEDEVGQNRERIRNLQELQADCRDCDEEVEAIIDDQIGKIEAEQIRLSELAKNEKEKKGIIGWFMSLFNR